MSALCFLLSLAVQKKRPPLRERGKYYQMKPQKVYEDFVSLWTVCLPQARQNFFTSTLYSLRLPREK